MTVRDNEVSAHRDGIYFEFVRTAEVRGNTVTQNRRYGLHFMRSDSCSYAGNRFENNRGSTAYGLLLKNSSDGTVRDNRFAGNTVGLYLEDSNRNAVDGNTFEGNSFSGNTFDVSTNSRTASSSFSGNWWDHYRGYDLDRDSIGDVPYRPVRLFSLVVSNTNRR